MSYKPLPLPLPEPTIIDGRMLYTAGDMREYARLCMDSVRKHEPPTTKRDTPAYDMPPGFETLFKGIRK